MPRPSHSALDDPLRAQHAWSHFRRLMTRVLLVALAVDAAALGYMRWARIPFHLHLVLALVIGLTLTVLLGSALMLLGFMSAATGHDQEVQAVTEEQGFEPLP